MTWKYNDETIDESQIYDIVAENYTYEQYDETLDECYGLVKICGLEYSTSHALKMVDEVAYKCGFNDEVDYIANEIIYNQDESDYMGFGIKWVEESDE